MHSKLTLLLFTFIIGFSSNAQIGGNYIYTFLNLSPNAKVNALGGYAIAIPDADVNMNLQNPALLKPEMHNQAAFNYMRFVSDISAGYFGYAFSIDTMNVLAGGIQYISYGTFNGTDENGMETGTFTSGEYNIHLSYSRKLSNTFRAGGTLKFINSNLEKYTSVGLAIDGGINYYNPENLLSVSAVVSNAGLQLKTYRDENRENLPLNIMLGFSKKFKHNPLRVSVTAHNLQSPGKLLYTNAARPGQNKDLTTGQIVLENITVLDKIAAHLNVSTEILLGKFMYVGFGYNHLRRYEMKLNNTSGTAGFGWGFGIKMKKLQVAYGSAAYHAAYATNSFSCVIFINEFSKNKN
ncbi:MAG: type IX secretion system protein PorQ [Bacteroidia bacterium]|nr:type IX secretion system protein PorQ [Bacteroidia bacterium]